MLCAASYSQKPQYIQHSIRTNSAPFRKTTVGVGAVVTLNIPDIVVSHPSAASAAVQAVKEETPTKETRAMKKAALATEKMRIQEQIKREEVAREERRTAALARVSWVP
jgi:hypothetical protein